MHINGLTIEEIKHYISPVGLPAFRAKQIFEWTQQKLVGDFAAMTNISKSDQEKLQKLFSFYPLKVLKQQKSRDGTKKYLFLLEDKQQVETVLLRSSKQRKTLCLSTQVGCELGCAICATGKMGFKRNLTAAEILAQIHRVSQDSGEIDNIVFMGMGEPFLNYDNVLKSILIINHKAGLNIGARKITISTAGIPDKIIALANFPLQVRLAISLNSADNEKRSKLMPINKKYPLEELLRAIRTYIDLSGGRRVTLEYALLKDFNDQEEDARDLVDLCTGLNVNINLIPANSPPPPYQASSIKTQENFLKLLNNSGLNAVLRLSKGDQIKAACGQLAT